MHGYGHSVLFISKAARQVGESETYRSPVGQGSSGDENGQGNNSIGCGTERAIEPALGLQIAIIGLWQATERGRQIGSPKVQFDRRVALVTGSQSLT